MPRESPDDCSIVGYGHCIVLSHDRARVDGVDLGVVRSPVAIEIRRDGVYVDGARRTQPE